jgi:hypothetical protein
MSESGPPFLCIPQIEDSIGKESSQVSEAIQAEVPFLESSVLMVSEAIQAEVEPQPLVNTGVEPENPFNFATPSKYRTNPYWVLHSTFLININLKGKESKRKEKR